MGTNSLTLSIKTTLWFPIKFSINEMPLQNRDFFCVVDLKKSAVSSVQRKSAEPKKCFKDFLKLTSMSNLTPILHMSEIRLPRLNSFSPSVSLGNFWLSSSAFQFFKNYAEKVKVRTSNSRKGGYCSGTKACDKSVTKPCVYRTPEHNGGQDCVSASVPLSWLSLVKCSLKSNYVHQGDVRAI